MDEEDFTIIPLDPYKLADKYLRLAKREYNVQWIVLTLFDFIEEHDLIDECSQYLINRVRERVRSSVTKEVGMKTKEEVEEAYQWIVNQEDYPLLNDFYDHYGFQDGQVLLWYLRVKLHWIIRVPSDEGSRLMSVRVDNPKLQKMLDESVQVRSSNRKAK